MLTNCILEELKKEEDLTKVWPKEAQNFTPWVANNLNLINEILGMELELVETESKVGSFSADIVAKDTETGGYVVIENQLNDTDHDHLGKIITYASGKDAKTIVWIVKRARDEHRQAIEWLNANTDPEVGFYLLEIELWQIGDSNLAPKFNVVEKPNNWAKSVKPKSNITDNRLQLVDFWNKFNEFAKKTDFTKIFKLRSSQPQNFYEIAIGSSKYKLNIEAIRQKRQATAGIYINNDKELYKTFETDKDKIEANLGVPIIWRDAKKDSRFFTTISFDINDTESWPNIFKWYIDRCFAFKKVIQPYVK